MAATVVDTKSGKISGVTSDGVHVFKGIPYGASTAGANRFMPPRKPEPWTGVREAIAYAGRSPQAAPPARSGPSWRRSGARSTRSPDGEDCLTLHVWTPGLDNAQAAGHGLAARRRLLLRLGQLAALRRHQPRAAQRRRRGRGQPPPQHLRPSRPLGDRRRALRAIRQCRRARPGRGAANGCATTSQRFGGDPGNVTIFGQSGGGGKVSALLGHAAAPRACSTRRSCRAAPACASPSRERTTQLADAVLKQLGMGPDQLDKLQAMPVADCSPPIAPAQKTLPQADAIRCSTATISGR